MMWLTIVGRVLGIADRRGREVSEGTAGVSWTGGPGTFTKEDSRCLVLLPPLSPTLRLTSSEQIMSFETDEGRPTRPGI